MKQKQNGGSSGRRVSTPAKLAVLSAALMIFSSSCFVDVNAFHLQSMTTSNAPSSSTSLHLDEHSHDYVHNASEDHLSASNISRRGWFSMAPKSLALVAVAATSGSIVAGVPDIAIASESNLGEITDKVFVDVSGLSASASAETGKTQRIVLGLFGKDAPSSVQRLKLLHATSGSGLPAPCKPLKEDFLIQREQLEANKVYRSCIEGQDKGVTYDYAQIWRIIKDERIDFGSLSGKFNAREYPTWAEKSYANPSEYTTGPSKYLMAVRKGSDSGFGYTLFPTATVRSNKDFLENYVVVGSVLEGDEIVDQINNVSVVASAKVNYMSIVGGGSGNKSNAPKKDCRYGGPMYCNENKPLTKLTMFRTGVL